VPSTTDTSPPDDLAALVPPLRRIHAAIRDAVVHSTEEQGIEALARVAEDTAGDTIYAIDRVGEEALVEVLERELGAEGPIALVAEGLAECPLVLPRGAHTGDARWRLLVDPIDGTRGLMYQKRPAWVLTGVARERGDETSLRHVELAMQTEIPLVKQHLGDQLWAIRGRGATGVRRNRITGEEVPLELQPSSAQNILQGFAMLTRFFPGAREVLAAIDEEVVHAAVGEAPEGRALCFEDQYIASSGQLYELCSGHDRFNADLRPLLAPLLRERGLPAPMCAHPYDLSAVLIAEELGVEVTDARGEPLDAPFDVETNVAWVGYANRALRERLEPLLLAALERHGLLPPKKR